jgi:hypothetical protein
VHAEKLAARPEAALFTWSMLSPSIADSAYPPSAHGKLLLPSDLEEFLDSGTQLARELSADETPQNTPPPPTESSLWSGYFDSNTQIARELTDEQQTFSLDWVNILLD